MFEIFETTEGRKKTYIVTNTDTDPAELHQFAKRYFKVTAERIQIRAAWVKGNDLYLEFPEKKCKRVWVAYLR